MTTSLPFRFGVSQFTTWPWSFEQDVDNYVRLGVDVIEVCEVKLDEDRAEEQLEFVGRRGLTIGSVQPAVRTLFPSQLQPEPKDPHERTAQVCQTIERLGRFAHGVSFVCNTGPPPNGNIQEVFDAATREYRTLADFAQGHGARIALEPLSPAIMNVETAIWTLEQAMRIVEIVDHDNFGVCVDTYNVWQNQGVVEEIKALGERIFVVQVSDWRTPRSFADRCVVGQGEIPLSALIRAIRESGYRGAYTLEILSQDVPDPLWEADLSEVIRESRTGLEKAYREAIEPS
ncbi:MAG: sugar phosphate isomerase/epimerase [Actinomycetota bacterium]|nr:sugar phosphate isomerase/epimerase [Actinomycetota bacterium]